MLLRNSISNTRRFFQKTIQNFKSFFSGGSYQRLPKTPPHNDPRSCTVSNDMNAQVSFNNKDFDNFYNDITNRRDAENANKRNKKIKSAAAAAATKQDNNDDLNGSFMKFSKASPVKNYQIKRREENMYKKAKNVTKGGKKSQTDNSDPSCITRQLVTQKLKELEMMDVSNVDHVLDIEEVIHYYSRLTCPAYLDIVDKFFMDMYAEFLGPLTTPRSVNSKPKLHPVRP